MEPHLCHARGAAASALSVHLGRSHGEEGCRRRNVRQAARALVGSNGDKVKKSVLQRSIATNGITFKQPRFTMSAHCPKQPETQRLHQCLVCLEP